MIRKLLLVSLAALGIGLTGCVTNPDKDTVDITLTTVPATDGGSYDIIATIVGSAAVSNITTSYTKSDGTAASGISFVKSPVQSKDSISIKATGGDMSIKMIVAPTTCDGDYVLTISASAGNKTESKTTPFTVTGKTNCSVTPLVIKVDSVTLGAFGNTVVGSSLDLDSGKVMMASDAKKATSGIDIVYTYSDALSASAICSPVYVKESSTVAAFQNWESPNDTKFHKVTVDFDATTTAAQIAALYDVTKVTEKRIAVNVGDVLIVKTDKDNYVLIKIKATFVNSSAIAMIKYAL